MDINFNVEIKPFSVNQAWKGQKYKTVGYKAWRNDFSLLVKSQITKLKSSKVIFPICGFTEVHYEFYIRSFKRVDGENFIKATSDALVENGIIEDDRFIKRYLIDKYPLNDLDKEHIEIKIMPWEKDLYKTLERKR